MGMPGSSRKLLVFELGAEACALDLDRVQEVLPMARLSQPPGKPHLLEGFLNLGGTAIPVVRLDRLFGLPESRPGVHTHLVLLRPTGSSTALLVDRAAEVVTVPDTALVPLGAGSCFNDCADADVALPGRTAHLLAPERLLLAQEQRRIAELQAEEQRRLDELEQP